MRKALIFSAAFHIVILVIAIVGLPHFWREVEVEESAIVVDLVQVSERTVAPVQAPKPKEPPKEPPKPEAPKPEPVKEQPKPEPPKAEPPKPEPVKAQPKETPAPPPPPPPPPAKEEPKPEPPKVEAKKEEPKPAPPKPEVKKPEPPKEEPKKDPPKKVAEEEDPFKSLLKSVEQMKKDTVTPEKKEEKPKPPEPPVQQVAAQAPKVYNAPVGQQATMSEKDAIRAQIEQQWLVDPGALGAQNMQIALRISIDQSGRVGRVEIVDMARYATDASYRAMADSAVRAVQKASPLKYPVEKYDTFKQMELVFDPQSRL